MNETTQQRRAWSRLAFGLLALASLGVWAGCASPTSDFPKLRPGLVRETASLSIAGRQQFEVGSDSSDAFSMQVQNRGSVPVRFVTRDADGVESASVAIQPGTFLQPRVPAGSTAIFKNATRMRTASMIVRVDADRSVPMRVQPLK